MHWPGFRSIAVPGSNAMHSFQPPALAQPVAHPMPAFASMPMPVPQSSHPPSYVPVAVARPAAQAQPVTAGMPSASVRASSAVRLGARGPTAQLPHPQLPQPSPHHPRGTLSTSPLSDPFLPTPNARGTISTSPVSENPFLRNLGSPLNLGSPIKDCLKEP